MCGTRPRKNSSNHKLATTPFTHEFMSFPRPHWFLQKIRSPLRHSRLSAHQFITTQTVYMDTNNTRGFSNITITHGKNSYTTPSKLPTTLHHGDKHLYRSHKGRHQPSPPSYSFLQQKNVSPPPICISLCMINACLYRSN